MASEGAVSVAVLTFLHDQPLMLLFLSVGLGALLGRVRIGIVSLGSTASTLLVGLLISAAVYFGTGLKFDVPGEIDTIFLQLFIFAIGLKVGPQFFSGLQREGFHLVAIGLITATLNFALIVGAAKALDFAPGCASGLISGSYTITAVIGVATGAIDSGTYVLPAGVTASQAKANIAAAYAIVYIFSTLLIILMVRYLPTLFRIDPVAAASKAEASFGGDSEAPLPSTADEFRLGYLPTDLRAYRVESADAIGRTVDELQERWDTSIVKLLRAGEALALGPGTSLARGDEITVFGDLDAELGEAAAIGPETTDRAARDVEMTVAEIVLTNRSFVHESLGQLHQRFLDDGLLLKALFRHAHPMPLLPGTTLKRGDVLRVYGGASSIETAGARLGTVLRASNVTDIATLAFGLVLGFLIGAVSVPVFGIPFGLGTSGGVILSGILIGTLRTYFPLFGGPVPEGARALMQSIGLDLFIAVLALNVAPDMIDALRQGNQVLMLLVVGLTAAVLPAFVSWLVGLYVFRMDPIILAGAVAGSRNSTPALNAIQQQSRSTVPAIGYPVPYALTAMVVLIYGYIAMLIG